MIENRPLFAIVSDDTSGSKELEKTYSSLKREKSADWCWADASFASCQFNENDTYSSATCLRFMMMHTCCNEGQFYYMGKSCTGLASLSDSTVR